MLTYLDRLKPGDICTLVRLDVPKALVCRLRDFGFVPGTKTACRYRSPDSCVTALAFRGTVLALRTSDLQSILVRIS